MGSPRTRRFAQAGSRAKSGWRCAAPATFLPSAGTDGEAQSRLVATIAARLTDLVRRAGLHTRLREFNLDRSQLDELAQRVFAEPGLAFNPRPIESAGQIREILVRAW